MNKIGDWIKNALTIVAVAVMVLMAVGSVVDCTLGLFRPDTARNDYDEDDYSSCDSCWREVLSDDLISVEYDTESACAQCIDSYSKCVICKSFRHNDSMRDETHCWDCVDYVVVDYTSNGTPVVEIFDSIAWTKTDQSDIFSEISYNKDKEILYVRFRESGAAYRYLDFSFVNWKDFVDQPSLGSWYNTNIKGHYECQKIKE